jgi:hypothetical protein
VKKHAKAHAELLSKSDGDIPAFIAALEAEIAELKA